MTVDQDDHTHVTYSCYDSETLDYEFRYATNSLGSWSIQAVDHLSNAYGGSSAKVDENGKVHICYSDKIGADDYDLKYATNASGTWNIIYLDAAGEVGYSPSINLDDRGMIHASYTGQDSLWYATFPQGYLGD